MASCIIEGCEKEGGHLRFRFNTESGARYVSNVKMCSNCWKILHDEKRNTGSLPHADILFSTERLSVDIGSLESIAKVESIVLKKP